MTTRYGVEDSKWAACTYKSQRFQSRAWNESSVTNTKSPTDTACERRQRNELQTYSRVLKALRRLRWRSTLLLFSYQRALARDTNNVIAGINFEIFSDTGKANAAEIMFQSDFFEYYTLLERSIVWLLECFGMIITANSTTDQVPFPDQSANTRASSSIIGDSYALRGSRHQFHSNVLAALDESTNPLHSVLGEGHVRQYLGLAKEFRNRFKGAELEQVDDSLTGLHTKYEQLLISLQLDEMLARILLALEEARSLAGQHLAEKYTIAEVDMVGPDNDNGTAATSIVDDAMEWD